MNRTWLSQFYSNMFWPKLSYVASEIIKNLAKIKTITIFTQMQDDSNLRTTPPPKKNLFVKRKCIYPNVRWTPLPNKMSAKKNILLLISNI